jgi:hypothetical protein
MVYARHILVPLPIWVIFDQSGHFCLLVGVRFAPKADVRLGVTEREFCAASIDYCPPSRSASLCAEAILPIIEHRQRKRRNVMAATSPTADAAKAPSPPADETANDETLVEQFMKLVSGNPRFRAAAPAGKAFAIVGARPLPPR